MCSKKTTQSQSRRHSRLRALCIFTNSPYRITTRLLSSSHTIPKYHALARPQIAESEATHRAISYSTLTSTPILIVHMSSPVALSHARKAQSKQMLPIHTETCPHYMYLLSERLAATSHPFEHHHSQDHSHGQETKSESEEKDEWAGARHICAPPLGTTTPTYNPSGTAYTTAR